MDNQTEPQQKTRCMLCKSIFVWLALAGLLVYSVWMFMNRQPLPPPVSSLSPPPAQSAANFDECIAHGNPVMESYPRQCRTPDGKLFVEDIGNELEKFDVIRIAKPRPGQIITSPFEVSGEARGSWFFEASFPVRLLDADGNNIALDPPYIMTGDEWMTKDFVSFRATLEFEMPQTDMGILVLEKDNPSGLPEHADEVRVPVRFR
jgi:hypothetical protein